MSKPSAKQIEEFVEYLRDHGLSESTIEVYARDVRLAFTSGGLLRRLRDNGPAPKSRRRILASARRWADFTDDVELLKNLKKIRLPPARRRAVRDPITRDQLFAVVDELGGAAKKYMGEPERAALGLMAFRGFRVGDVLRMRRAELVTARDTGVLAYEGKGRKRIEYTVLKSWRRWVSMLANHEGEWVVVADLISPWGKPAGRRNAAAKAVERALSKLGVHIGVTNLHPHRLRRTYAVEYLRAMKGDAESVPKLTQHMQWADMNTALEYVDHERGTELDVVAARVFERPEKP